MLGLSAAPDSQSASPLLKSVPDGPSMAQAGTRQRRWGGKCLFHPCMTIMFCMCAATGNGRKRDVVYRAFPPIHSLLPP